MGSTRTTCCIYAISKTLFRAALECPRTSGACLLTYLSDVVGVHHRVPGSQHAAQGVTDDGHLIDVEGIKEAARAGGKLLEAELVILGLAGLAEADLVNGNDPVPVSCQLLDCFSPCRATEVLAAKKSEKEKRKKNKS
jgi:hypothetical protein